MTTPLLNHARGLLGGDAARRLPMFANRKVADIGVPAELRAPHTHDQFAALPSVARREQVARWAVQLVADFGAPVATSVVTGHLEEVVRRLAKVGETETVNDPARRAEAAVQDVSLVGTYVVACARGCGHISLARGPRAVVSITPLCKPSQRRRRPRASS